LWSASCHIHIDANHVSTKIYPLLIGEVNQPSMNGKSDSSYGFYLQSKYADLSKELLLLM